MDELKERLSLVASLSPGDTVSTTGWTIVNHTYWSTSFYRTYNGESRSTTLEGLRDLFCSSCEEARLHPEIERALVGLESLKATYSTDLAHVTEIDDLIRSVRERMDGIAANIEKEVKNHDIKTYLQALVEAPDAGEGEGDVPVVGKRGRGDDDKSYGHPLTLEPILKTASSCEVCHRSGCRSNWCLLRKL